MKYFWDAVYLKLQLKHTHDVSDLKTMLFLSALSSTAAGKVSLRGFPQVHAAVQDAALAARSRVCTNKECKAIRSCMFVVYSFPTSWFIHLFFYTHQRAHSWSQQWQGLSWLGSNRADSAAQAQQSSIWSPLLRCSPASQAAQNQASDGTL